MARKQKSFYDETYNAALDMHRQLAAGNGGMHYAAGYMLSFFAAQLDSYSLGLTRKQKDHILRELRARAAAEKV